MKLTVNFSDLVAYIIDCSSLARVLSPFWRRDATKLRDRHKHVRRSTRVVTRHGFKIPLLSCPIGQSYEMLLPTCLHVQRRTGRVEKAIHVREVRFPGEKPSEFLPGSSVAFRQFSFHLIVVSFSSHCIGEVGARNLRLFTLFHKDHSDL